MQTCLTHEVSIAPTLVWLTPSGFLFVDVEFAILVLNNGSTPTEYPEIPDVRKCATPCQNEPLQSPFDIGGTEVVPYQSTPIEGIEATQQHDPPLAC